MPAFKRRLMVVFRLSLFAAVTFVLLIWALGAYAGYQGVDEVLHPTRSVYCCDTPADVGIDYEDLNLITSDGLHIKGWFLAPGREAVVILAHGASGNRAGLFPVAQSLVEAGYSVILLDLRAHGESDGDVFTQGWLDIRAAVEYVHAQGVENIGVYGFSLGANMVIQEAAESLLIDAVIADGPSPVRLTDYRVPGTFSGVLYMGYDLMYWWQLDVKSADSGGFALRSAHEAVTKIAPRPLFLIAAGAENSGFEKATIQSLYDIYRASGGTGKMRVIDDVYHGGGIARDDYNAYIIDFLRTSLPLNP